MSWTLNKCDNDYQLVHARKRRTKIVNETKRWSLREWIARCHFRGNFEVIGAWSYLQNDYCLRANGYDRVAANYLGEASGESWGWYNCPWCSHIWITEHFLESVAMENFHLLLFLCIHYTVSYTIVCFCLYRWDSCSSLLRKIADKQVRDDCFSYITTWNVEVLLE